MKNKLVILVLAALALPGATTVFGQRRVLVPGIKLAKEAKAGDIQAEIVRQVDAAGKKFIALAEATPQEKYLWRPGEGVRSISEVFMHVAQANYGLIGITGIKPLSDIPKEMEKITDKKEVIEHLKKSFEYARTQIGGTSDADIEKVVKFFGNDSTVRNVYMFLGIHAHEHLGQSIAYSRVNGIVPPWNAGRDGV